MSKEAVVAYLKIFTHSGRFIRVETSGIRLMGGCLGPESGLDAMEDREISPTVSLDSIRGLSNP